MFNYANVDLVDVGESVGVNAAGWIAANIQPHSLFPLAYRAWPGQLGNGPLLNISPEEPRPVIIGSLFWPRGASRFARGHFLVSGQQLAKIRQVTVFGGKSVTAPFVFRDGTNTLTTSLWMMPALPISQAATGLELYLLTLVDDRYWWWGMPVDVAVNAGVTTWANLYSSIGTAIGTTITVDMISANYGMPTTDYSMGAAPAPTALDAVAFSVGQRVIRTLTGAVKTQNVATATVAVKANLALATNAFAGGMYDLNPTQ